MIERQNHESVRFYTSQSQVVHIQSSTDSYVHFEIV